MVKKIYKYLIIICIFCLTGCANDENLSVEHSNELWKVTDTKINALPEDALVVGVTNDGIYYEQTLDYNPEESKESLSYHFLSLSGEDILVYHEDVQSSYRSYFVKDKDLILSICIGEGVKVLELSQNGEVREVFTQNAVQLPLLQSYEGKLLSIRNNITEDGYENNLILSDSGSGKETVIYKTVDDIEQGTGEDIVCASLNGSEVCFTVEEMDGGISQYWLYIYDISKDEIVEKVQLERRSLFAAQVEDKVILSETDDMTFLENAGSIGKIVDGEYQETGKLPLVTASNMIRRSLFKDNVFYLISANACYLWDVEKDKIFVYQMDKNENLNGSVYATDQGFMCVVKKGSEMYLRNINIK